MPGPPVVWPSPILPFTRLPASALWGSAPPPHQGMGERSWAFRNSCSVNRRAAAVARINVNKERIPTCPLP